MSRVGGAGVEVQGRGGAGVSFTERAAGRRRRRETSPVATHTCRRAEGVSRGGSWKTLMHTPTSKKVKPEGSSSDRPFIAW